MTQRNSAARLSIKELETPPVSEGAVVTVNGSATRLEQRRRRRRLDLKTTAGTVRESIRVYRDLVEGRCSMAEAEIRGRQLRRHLDLLTAVEQREQLGRIEQQLRELQAARNGQLPALPAPSEPAQLPEWARETGE